MGAWWIGTDTALGVGIRGILRECDGAPCRVVPSVMDIGDRAAPGDLVLAAIDGPGDGHRRSTRERFGARPELRPVAVASTAAERVALSLLVDGWIGVILATATPMQVGDACERLRAGRRAIAGLGSDANDRLDDLDACWPGRDVGLSRRESEVLAGLADGLSAAQIAERLVIGRETVRTHLRTLYRSMGVCDRGAAVAEGFRRGIIG